MSCGKCGGAGWYRYDHNHSKLCEQCCPHAEGVWQLSEHYLALNGRWCCLQGCGTTWRTKDDYASRVCFGTNTAEVDAPS